MKHPSFTSDEGKFRAEGMNQLCLPEIPEEISDLLAFVDNKKNHASKHLPGIVNVPVLAEND